MNQPFDTEWAVRTHPPAHAATVMAATRLPWRQYGTDHADEVLNCYSTRSMVPGATHHQQVIMSKFMCVAAGQAQLDATADNRHCVCPSAVLQATASRSDSIDMLQTSRSVHFGSQTAALRTCRTELSENQILHAGS